MIIIVPLFVLLVVCLVKMSYDIKEGEYMPVSMLFSGVLGLFLLIVFAAVYFNPYSVRGEIAQYYAVKASIADARVMNVTDIERAALTQKIIETNRWLAQIQFDNHNLWDMFIPDEVDNLKPLK